MAPGRERSGPQREHDVHLPHRAARTRWASASSSLSACSSSRASSKATSARPRTSSASSSVYSMMQFVFAPILGGLSDRFGRRGVILPSLLGAATSYILSGLAPSLAWLFVGRLIAGATGASFSAANAYVADITPPRKRGRCLGQAASAWASSWARRSAESSAIALRIFIQGRRRAELRTSTASSSARIVSRESRRAFSFARANLFASLANLGRHPIVLGLTGTLTATYLAQMILQSVWALSSQARSGWTPRPVGRSSWRSAWSTAIVQGARAHGHRTARRATRCSLASR